ncbi:hypothetical protein [Hydrogenophaga sp. PAMC20947]|uniref:hypothetical protein n=1 Tax=Hydrogenophaga sp. PAMC20947 TaxID=2565558 RepID=UPI00109DE690|nr:hypothetical protein [Hydrogenophaga sp. PAMC20947]QCB46623.1 hypothetical protein E5678_11665 [Hydrogenophaga sp. PAMC20947]
MKALSNRLARLEQATPDGPRPVLVLIFGVGFDRETLTGVDGLEDHPRINGEGVDDYIARLEVHLRATRGRALPFVGFAQCGLDDVPDAPHTPKDAVLSSFSGQVTHLV